MSDGFISCYFYIFVMKVLKMKFAFLEWSLFENSCFSKDHLKLGWRWIQKTVVQLIWKDLLFSQHLEGSPILLTKNPRIGSLKLFWVFSLYDQAFYRLITYLDIIITRVSPNVFRTLLLQGIQDGHEWTISTFLTFIQTTADCSPQIGYPIRFVIVIFIFVPF